MKIEGGQDCRKTFPDPILELIFVSQINSKHGRKGNQRKGIPPNFVSNDLDSSNYKGEGGNNGRGVNKRMVWKPKSTPSPQLTTTPLLCPVNTSLFDHHPP